MNKIVLTLWAAILFLNGYSIDKKVESRIDEVTVFLNNAQIERKAKTHLTKGKNQLIFSGISPHVDLNTIKVTGNGSITILNAGFELDYTNESHSNQKIEQLVEQRDSISEMIEFENTLLNVTKKELLMLDVNSNVSSNETTSSSAIIKAISKFYGDELKRLQLKKLKQTKQIDKLKEKYNRINFQVRQIRLNLDKTMGQIVVMADVKKTGSYSFELSYIVRNASWHPSYDIRANDIDRPLSIVYKANVRQTTGVDWKNVKLHFSSSQPSSNNIAPTLHANFLQFINPKEVLIVNNEMEIEDYELDTDEELELSEVVVTPKALRNKMGGIKTSKNRAKREAKSIPIPVRTKQSTLAVNFDIETPYTIDSDRKNLVIDMTTLEVDAAYEYLCVPKLDKHAYLMSYITDWKRHNFLTGNANVFFENTFVGKTILKTAGAGDSLQVSLGVDKAITAERNSIQNNQNRRFFGNKITELRSWEIVVNNNRSNDVRIAIVDQIPVSINQDIEIEKLNISDGKLDPLSGEIRWMLDLSPTKPQKLKLKYSVKYPKDKRLDIE